MYKTLRGLKDLFDTSNYPPDHDLYSVERMKQPGCFSDQAGGIIIAAYAGLRPKVLSQKVLHGRDIRKCAGVPKHIANCRLRHDVYLDTLLSGRQHREEYNTLGSENLLPLTYRTNCVVLCPADTSRFVMEGTHFTLPYGHVDLAEIR